MKLCDVICNTPIHPITPLHDTGNEIYLKRDDLQPFSFGGNKVRIAQKIIMDMLDEGCDVLITYGSKLSNLCRVTTNLCCALGIECYMISVTDDDHGCARAFNGTMTELFGAKIVECAKADVDTVLKELQDKLSSEGKKSYFVNDPHAITAECTAYKDTYSEIYDYQVQTGLHFDYIFTACGMGTTVGGLIIGKMLHPDYGKEGTPNPTIVGISTARLYERGMMKLNEHITNYFARYENRKPDPEIVKKELNFTADYLCGGYGLADDEIKNNCIEMMRKNGIELDPTYTGKAYTGAEKYLKENGITGKKVLFIHTGGSPLYFDMIR